MRYALHVLGIFKSLFCHISKHFQMHSTELDRAVLLYPGLWLLTAEFVCVVFASCPSCASNFAMSAQLKETKIVFPLSIEFSTHLASFLRRVKLCYQKVFAGLKLCGLLSVKLTCQWKHQQYLQPRICCVRKPRTNSEDLTTHRCSVKGSVLQLFACWKAWLLVVEEAQPGDLSFRSSPSNCQCPSKTDELFVFYFCCVSPQRCVSACV